MLGPASVALTLVAAAPAAHAGDAPPPANPTDDGSCDTRPTGYPADGDPVPDDAGCTLILAADTAVIGEVWSWGDAESVHWYNYAVSTLPPTVDGAVSMCGSTDSGAEGVEYTCSAESTYLLFTVSGVFVEWPTTLSDALHFCEQVSFGSGSTVVVGRACSSVANDSVDNDPLGGVPPTQTPTPSPPGPSEPPTEPSLPEESPPTTAPSDGAVPSDDPADGTEDPGEEEVDGGAAVPIGSDAAAPTDASPPVPPAGTAPDTSPATGAPLPPDGAGPPAATPVQGTSVALVGGSRFPMGFVLVLALALAFGGYVTLAAPGLVAARRQRR